MAAWNGQFFHGRLLGREGLRSEDIERVLPQAPMTAAEKRAARDAEMFRRVAAINGAARRREAMDH